MESDAEFFVLEILMSKQDNWFVIGIFVRGIYKVGLNFLNYYLYNFKLTHAELRYPSLSYTIKKVPTRFVF